jgi:hypothetical protein
MSQNPEEIERKSLIRFACSKIPANSYQLFETAIALNKAHGQLSVSSTSGHFELLRDFFIEN